ncbi:hypothetical protein SAMN04488548_1221, partial [Gordonia westfalica]
MTFREHLESTMDERPKLRVNLVRLPLQRTRAIDRTILDQIAYLRPQGWPGFRVWTRNDQQHGSHGVETRARIILRRILPLRHRRFPPALATVLHLVDMLNLGPQTHQRQRIQTRDGQTTAAPPQQPSGRPARHEPSTAHIAQPHDAYGTLPRSPPEASTTDPPQRLLCISGLLNLQLQLGHQQFILVQIAPQPALRATIVLTSNSTWSDATRSRATSSIADAFTSGSRGHSGVAPSRPSDAETGSPSSGCCGEHAQTGASEQVQALNYLPFRDRRP